ncbi:3-hydroxybutyrate dehydrogenase (plasmid) [Natronomonas pharaonis DSM 2160]|uniref:3-hydroxybutyrate dehydrogenase n=1 Tax=Natronomonas pharaonis (strain ATCC 35678 / DSM 2160 / CIP 103997 / JCM 8858 / NBRC 14720 / NCIMB 2260 / Gabara) TaxID=348780 RepID=Q3IM60_NATPD|nr:SDR family NAD(P)-dependent oxidoreductase [Natronomonas pharaonis]CAI50800.1 3-hydroxybutyrate dehydrogenase [Natronomonas pharaonis DSM 2160]
MSSPEAEDSIEPPEITTEVIHRIDDPHFTSNNVALVTGAASGIGRATALVLAANGLTTVATDVDEDGLYNTAQKGEELNVDGEIKPIVCDLTDDAEIEALAETAANAGQLRYVVNVAGMQHVAPIESFPMEMFDRLYQVMLRAPMYITQLALPHIREADDGVGAVANMASVHGHYVTRDKVAYNTMKFGLRGLTKSIAAEGESDIRAFTASTGYVKTPLVLDQIAATAHERDITEREVVEDVMLGQARGGEMMEPIEVGNLFAFGLSRHGKHLNGDDLLWDDGFTNTYE